MHSSIESTDKQIRRARSNKRPCSGASISTTNAFLTLPVLSPEIPIASSCTDGNKKWAKIAELCLELVDKEDEVFADLKEDFDPRQVIDRALGNWASKHLAEVAVLNGFNFSVSLDAESVPGYVGYGNTGSKEEEERKFYISLVSSDCQQFVNIGQKIAKLEKQHKGLGRAAIEALELASLRTIPAFTPSLSFYHASHLYWYGQETDKDFLEEREGYGEEEELDEGFLTPNKFKAQFPEIYFKGKRTTDAGLKKLAMSQRSLAGKVADICQNIFQLHKQEARLPMNNLDGESAYFSCLISIGDSPDTMGRVADDFYNEVNHCSDSYTDVYGTCPIELDRAKFLAWKAEMENGFALYVQFERLIREIGVVT